MAVAEESNTATTAMMMIDQTYEFSAPFFFDFVKGESDEECRMAELWFDADHTYAPSRTFLISSFVNFLQFLGPFFLSLISVYLIRALGFLHHSLDSINSL